MQDKLNFRMSAPKAVIALATAVVEFETWTSEDTMC